MTMLGRPHDDAFDPSVRALCSALLRELDTWTIGEHEGRMHVALPLHGGARLELSLARPPGVGRLPILAARWCSGDATQTIDARELVARLVADPSSAAALGLAPDQADRFVARVRASVAALEQVVTARADALDHLASAPLGFVAAEQALLLGHSVHPAPRMREGVPADALACVPELGGAVQLHAWSVASTRWIAEGQLDAIGSLLRSDPAWAAAAGSLAGDRVCLLVHPLQHRALLDEPRLADARRRGELVPLGPLGRAWAPTSSLRTLHGDAPWMLKTSLPIRLTNSRRTLARVELERGLLFDRVLAQAELRDHVERWPSLALLREPAFYGVRDDRGDALAASFVALRENPWTATQPVEVLATLLADHPRSGEARLARRLREAGRASVAAVEAWFAAYCERVLAPIVALAVEQGVLLSAHQQNLVIGFADDGLTPARAWFRDAQGSAYSDLALQRFGERVSDLSRAHFGAPLAERAWAYSVVINGVFNVIASLGHLPGIDQGLLLEQLRAHLLGLRERMQGDPRMLAALLDAPQLWTKANVRAFASGRDEVDLPDPLAIYRPLANPLVRRATPTMPASLRGRAANHAHACAALELDGERGLITIGERRETFALAWRDAGERALVRGCSSDVRPLVSDWLLTHLPGLAQVEHEGEAGTQIDRRASFWQRGGVWDGQGTLLYRRHCAAIDRSFSLRRFSLEADLARFHAWMNDPVVDEFWQQAWSREQLAGYLQAKIDSGHVIPAIGSFDDQPFAYFEIYDAAHDRLAPLYAVEPHDRGFHMAVGSGELRHRGLGRQWFLAMAHYLFMADPATQRLVGEPRVDQARVRAWARSTAWQEWGEIAFPHKRAVLMVLSRERMFASFEGGR